MGTDIYMYAEVRRNGVWSLAEPVERNASFDLDPAFQSEIPERKPREWYDGRNYELFSILGGVFDDMYCARPFDCLADHRGLPSDVSNEIRAWRGFFGDDAYGDSYLAISEAREVDWFGKTLAVCRRPETAAWWRRIGPYKITYAEAAGPRFLELLEESERFGPKHDVRLVFWFQS